MDKIIITRAKPSDVPGIMKLLSQVLSVHNKIRPDIYLAGTTKYSEAELMDIISNDLTPVFTASDSVGNVLGHAFCKIIDYSGTANLVPVKTLYIDDFCVDESCRGKRVGAKLYGYVREYAQKNGCHNITLNVWEGNDGAKSFYSAMGMKTQRTTMEEILDN